MPRMQVTDRQIVKMTAEEYHKLPHISSTQIRCFKQEGPWQFYHKYVGKKFVEDDSEDRLFGRVVHAVLEGRKIDDVCVTEPETIVDPKERARLEKKAEKQGDGGEVVVFNGDTVPINKHVPRHREYLTQWKELQQQSGKVVISAQQYATVAPMVELTLSNPAVQDLLRHEHYKEVPFFGFHKATGLQVKSLADVFIPNHPQGPTIVDWKTTKAKTSNECIEEGFRRWAYNYQAGWYTDVCGVKYFKFVFIKKDDIQDVFVFNVPADVLSAASEANDQALIELKDCIDTNSWHSMGWGAELEFSMSERFHQ